MKYLLLTFYFSIALASAQSVVINELLPKNISVLQENCGRVKCPDWIELLNTTNADIDISNYYLSDDSEDLMKWQVPSGTTIEANGFFFIFTENAENNSVIKTNFNLASNGETLTLSDASGTLVQQITYPPTQNDVSYGRLSNGNYTFFETPTPRTANADNTSFAILDSDLSITTPSGVYASSQTVEISHTGPGAIFYTLDGTLPNENSIPYTGSITITSNTALKAIVIENESAFSIVENRSYIIGATHDLPIILLSSDNSENVAGSRRNKQVIDGRVEFSFIETDGTTVINQYANFRESGNASRGIIQQINGKIEADNLYGDNDFDHKFFPNKDIDEFKTVFLRNSSQDWAHTHLRDAFVSRLLSTDNIVNFPFEGFRPAVLYVNAVYQGIINIREDDDTDYVEHNYNLDEGEFFRPDRRSLFIEPNAPLPTDREAINSVINFNNYTNIRLLINYSLLREQGFGWWEDLSGKTGQQYHQYMHDFDVSFGNISGSIFAIPEPMDITSLLDSEIDANPAYRSESLQFVAAALNHLYNTDRTLAILDDMVAELESEIPAHGEVNTRLLLESGRNLRTPPFANLAEWQENINVLRTNISDRIDTDIFNRIQAEYTLDTPVQVSYNSSNINQGFVRVHEIKILEESATGTYFSNIPVKLSAEALPGFRFVRWEGDATGTSEDIAPTFNSNATITAVFEPISFTTNDAVINEVQGKNDTTVADENGEFDDWIEIYNPSSTPINLAGLYFSDNFSTPLKWQIPDTDPSKTTVPANGYLLLWADNDVDQGENHLGFRLKGTDQVLITYPDGVTEKQRIEFTDIDTDQSYGAENDLAPNFISFSSPTPNSTNIGATLSTTDFNNTNFNIYPNPTRSDIFINTTSLFKNQLDWKIYSITGNLINTGSGKKVDMSNLNSGLYFIQINNKTSYKIIKQ